MTKLEKEALEGIVGELELNEGDDEKQEKILLGISSELPDGRAKDFFQEIEQILVPFVEIVKEQDDERIDEALEAVRTAKRKFRRDEFLEGIPEKIIEIYKEYLGTCIAILKMIKGMNDLFE